MKNKEIEELLDYYQKEIDKYEETKKYLMEKYGYDEETIDNISQHQRYKNNKLLLSYIEQLENKNKENSLLLIEFQDMEQRIEQLEKRNKQLYEGFMATQEELTDYATKNEQLEKLCNKYEQEHKTTFETWKEDIEKLEQLQNNREKAIEVIDLITPELWNISNKMTYRLKDIKYLLKGGSDEQE